LEVFGDESDVESDASSNVETNCDTDDDSLPLVVKTRYGRHAGHWNLYQLQ
jgi:hypothetical protein